jgi:hypothetical protein
VGADGYCYQWAIQPVQTRKSVRSFSYNKIPFYAVASAGDFVFAGGQAPFAVYQWHISDGRLLNILNGHTASIQALAVSGDDFLFSGGNDQLIIQWRLTDGQQVRNITGHSGTVNALFVSNKTVFSGSADATVKQWYVPEPLISPSPTQSVVPTPRPLPPPPASNDLLIKILGSLFGAVAFLALVFFIAQYMYIKYLTKKADALAPKQLAFGQPQVKGPPDNGDFHEIRDTGGKRESQSILVATAAKQDGVISRPGMTLRGKDVQQSQDTVAGSNMALNV